MDIHITFRHMESTEALKSHVNEKLSKIERYLHKPVEIRVVLSVERFLQIAEFQVSAKQFSAHFEESSEDMYASIDKAIDKIEKAARRHKEKTKQSKSVAV
jgi:putative sigma-54 modulation protein